MYCAYTRCSHSHLPRDPNCSNRGRVIHVPPRGRLRADFLWPAGWFCAVARAQTLVPRMVGWKEKFTPRINVEAGLGSLSLPGYDGGVMRRWG